MSTTVKKLQESLQTEAYLRGFEHSKGVRLANLKGREVDETQAKIDLTAVTGNANETDFIANYYFFQGYLRGKKWREDNL